MAFTVMIPISLTWLSHFSIALICQRAFFEKSS